MCRQISRILPGSRRSRLPFVFFLLLFSNLLIFLPASLSAQTADFSFPVSPRLPFPPIVSPPVHLPPVTPPVTIGLGQLTQAAGTIFSGTVISVERRPATEQQAIETVAITFHVEQAIRGTTPGQHFTITQWMGLWSSGQRYRVGERVFLFLYPPSKLGLTSSVGGAFGRFAVDPFGILFSAQHVSAFRSDPILGGKSRATFHDFALAIQRSVPQVSIPHLQDAR